MAPGMIVLLTYDAPHRKTQDVAFRLLAAGHKFRVLAVPWEERKPRRFLYAHRPAELTWPCDPLGNPREFFDAFNIDYEVCPKGRLFEGLTKLTPDLVIVGGAGILPEAVVTAFRVLNVHPGFLPQCRGLDILKWTIIEGHYEVGVTAHLCDNEADLGWRICAAPVPVYEHDTFHAFAMRQYEMEIGLLAGAIDLLGDRPRDSFTRIREWGTKPKRRMGRKKERGLLPAFERYKEKYAK